MSLAVVVVAIIMLRQLLTVHFNILPRTKQAAVVLSSVLPAKTADPRFPQNVKTLLQVVVVASVQACTVIKCFHYLYEPPQQRRGLLGGGGVNLWIDGMT